MDGHDYASVPILERPDRVKGLPLEVRMGFVMKVYGIVFAMLLLSFFVASPFVFNPLDAQEFLEANPWVLYVCVTLLVAQQLMHLCVMLGLCTGNRSCFNCYMSLFLMCPINYIYLFTYAGVFGVLVGIASMQFTAVSVGLVFLLTAAILVALTVYAVRTQSDFSGLGPYVLVILTGILVIMVAGIFVPLGEPAHRVVAGLMAIAFGFIIVHDTQLIFGSVKGDNQKLEYTVDMYAFAAFDLYLDFVNFFLQMLQALGERRN